MPITAAFSVESLTSFLDLIGTFLTAAITWMSGVLASVTSSPPLTVLVLAIPISGFAVGLLSRLIRL